jgi:predicted SAM-dependent methyltransferase
MLSHKDPSVSSGEALKGFPKRLNLGCGFDRREGYLNVDLHDFHAPDLAADITNLEMLPSGAFEEVLAQDVLEHLPRGKIAATLTEWHRLLKTGGVLSLRVPNLAALPGLFTARERQSLDDQNTLVQCVYGTQAYEGDYHLAGFTPRLLTAILATVGFGEISITDRDGWLMEVRAVKGATQIAPTGNLIYTDSVCIAGWYPPETYGSEAYRWSRGRSLLNIRGAAGQNLYLTFRSLDPKATQAGVVVRLYKVGSNDCAATVTLRSDATVTQEIQVNEDDFLLEVLTETTFVPRFFLSTDDDRHLGVALQSAHLKLPPDKRAVV